MADERVAMQTTYQIPGFSLYKNLGMNIERDFVLRPMTTMEEKLRLSSPGFGTIAQIIKACLKSNVDLDINQLKVFDVQYLMYKLRTVTYGEDYRFSLVCPHCGGTLDVTVDLDKLNVNVVPDDFKEPFEIGPLPISKDTIQCRLFSVKDYLDILTESKAKLEKFPEMKDDPSFLIDLCKRVVTVNNKVLAPFQLEDYLKKMHARDYQYFDSKYTQLANSFGLDVNSMETECTHCNKKLKYSLPVTYEFFRPSY